MTDLFQECQEFTFRLQKYSEVALDSYFVEKLTATLRFLLDVFAQCEKVVRTSHTKLYWQAMFGDKNSILSSNVDALNRHFKYEEQFNIAQIYVNGKETRDEFGKFAKRQEEEDERRKKKELKADIEALSLDLRDIVAKQNEELRKSAYSRPEWIWRDEIFQKWHSEADITAPAWLWGLGNAGAGKTSLASFLASKWQAQSGPFEAEVTPKRYTNIESGEAQLESLPFSAVALFYCNFRNAAKQGPDAVFQSLIHQLLKRLNQVSPSRAEKRIGAINRLRDNEDSTGLSWTGLLDDLISEFQQTYIVVDALDDNEGGYAELVARLSRLKSPSLKLFVTSRDERSMRADAQAQGSVPLTIHAKDELIQSYVDARLSRIAQLDQTSELVGASALPEVLGEPGKKTQIVDKIVKGAEGNYLSAELQITSLKAERTREDLELVLDDLAAKSLPDVIRQAIARINGQHDTDKKEIGMKAFMWATYAGRILSIEELRHALALTIRPHTREDARAQETEVQRLTQSVIIEASRFFLRVDNGDVTVPGHDAIKDYCDKANIFEDAHYQMAETCLAFLDRRFFSLRCTSKAEYDHRCRENPFYQYAARHWGLHMKKAGERRFLGPTSPISMATLLSRKLFLNSIAVAIHEELQKLRMWNWADHNSWKELRGAHGPVIPPVHLLTYFDLQQTVDWWLRQNPHEVDEPSPTGTRPLYLACHLGHIRIVESLLFDFHADPTRKGALPFGHNLAAAVFVQSPDVIERLLYVNAKGLVSQENWHGRLPLGEAAMRENHDIVHMIIEAITALPNGVEILTSQERRDGWSALHEAAKSPHPNARIIELLLDAKGGKKMLQKKTKTWHDTPLHIAAVEGNTNALKKLLELGADPMDTQRQGKTPLHLAVEGLYEKNSEVIKALLESEKMDPTAQDKDGNTVWHAASICGRPRNLRFLVDKTPKKLFHTKNIHGMIPIRTAINHGKRRWQWCVKALLKQCPGELKTEDAYPVFDCLIHEHSDVGHKALKKLLEHPVEPWPLHRGKTTVLHRIVDHGTLEAVKFTWDIWPTKEVLEYRDAAGSTALLLAAKVSPFEKAAFLIDIGADLNAQDDAGRTALHYAIERDMADLAVLLLDRKADYQIKDHSGVSALERASAQNTCRKTWQVRNAIHSPSPPSQTLCLTAKTTTTHHIASDEPTKANLLKQNIPASALSLNNTEYLRTDPIPPTAKLPLLGIEISLTWRPSDLQGHSEVYHDLGILRNGQLERQHKYCGYEAWQSYDTTTQTHGATWHLERGLEGVTGPEASYGPRVDKHQRVQAFVRALKTGDRVVLVAVAKGEGAVNVVEGAEIKVFYED